MAIASIGQAPTTQAASNASIQMDDFLKVLTTQLSYQDPMKPMDNQQFMAQMAQFSSLQQAQQTNDNLVSLLEMQSAAQSVGLIGHTVEAKGPSGTSVGKVSTVRFVDGTPVVTIQTDDGQSIADLSLNSISVIR
jgi:flagellar basal-body rod modification protein FlgD